MNVQTSSAPKTVEAIVTSRRSRLLFLFAALVVLIAAAAMYVYLPQLRGPAIDNQILVSGNIEAHQSLVSFKDVTSRIIELPFDEGQWVQKDALLARLDDS